MIVNIMGLLGVAIFAYLAYLRKIDSPRLDKGPFAIPKAFSFKYLVIMTVIGSFVYCLLFEVD